MIQTYQSIFADLQGFDLILLISFATFFVLRFLYLLLFTSRILFQRKILDDNQAAQPLTLLLTVRNEEVNLETFLPGLLSIDGVEYEVVVVDDFSLDDSFLVLGKLRKEFARLKISMLNEETRFSMKLAQNIALKAASNDWVLVVPIAFSNTGKNWLSGIESVLSKQKNVVLAYSGIESSDQFFNQLYRIENYWEQLKSVGFVLNRMPFVYTDENVAFRKDEYFKMGGFGQKIKEPYANLELLINSFIRKKTTTVLFSAETSIRKTTTVAWPDYLDLLKKSFRVEKHLSNSKRLALGFEEFTRLLYPPLVVFVIVLMPELWLLFVSLLGIKLIAQLFIIKITQNRLNEPKIFLSSLTYDLIAPYFKFFYRWYFNQRNKKNKWRNTI